MPTRIRASPCNALIESHPVTTKGPPLLYRVTRNNIARTHSSTTSIAAKSAIEIWRLANRDSQRVEAELGHHYQ